MASDVIARWNRDHFNPRYAMACLCHEYLVEFPYSPRYAIYLVDLGITPDGQPTPLRFDIFVPVPEGLSRIDVLNHPEPGSPRERMGGEAFLVYHPQEPWPSGGHVRFEPTEPSRERRSSPERTHRSRSRSGQNRERQPSFTPVPVAPWAAPSLDHWSGGATTNPPVIYSQDFGWPENHGHLRDRQNESHRARYPVRHMEQSSPPEATRAPVPVPSAPDILLHHSPPPSSRQNAASASSSGINPRRIISHGSVREQSRRSERPESPRSYSRPTQSYATNPYHLLSDPVGRQSNAELGQGSHSSRDSLQTSMPPPLPPPLATLEVERREEPVSAPQGTVNLSPLDGK